MRPNRRRPHLGRAGAGLLAAGLAWACNSETHGDAPRDATFADGPRDATVADASGPVDAGQVLDAMTAAVATLGRCVPPDELGRPPFGVLPSASYWDATDGVLSWSARIESVDATHLVLRPAVDVAPAWWLTVGGDFGGADTAAGAAVNVYLSADFYNELAVTDADGLLFAGTDSGLLSTSDSAVVLSWAPDDAGRGCVTEDGTVRTAWTQGAGELAGVAFQIPVGAQVDVDAGGRTYRVAVDSAFTEAWDPQACDRCGEVVISALRLQARH